jgi:hypothetical protein
VVFMFKRNLRFGFVIIMTNVRYVDTTAVCGYTEHLRQLSMPVIQMKTSVRFSYVSYTDL